MPSGSSGAVLLLGSMTSPVSGLAFRCVQVVCRPIGPNGRLVACKGFLEVNGHDAPLADKLAQHRLAGHPVEVLVPEGGILPLVALGVVTRHEVGVGHAAVPGVLGLAALQVERLGVAVRVGQHLVLAPVQHLAEAVVQLEVGVVAHHRAAVPLSVVLQELQDGAAGEAVPASVLALHHGESVDVQVLPAALRQLDVALVAELELGHGAALLVLVGDHVILAELRGGGQVQALTQQGGGQHRPGVALLEGRVYGHGGADGSHEAPGAVRVSQGVVHELLVHRRLDSHAELGLAAAAALQRIVHGHD